MPSWNALQRRGPSAGTLPLHVHKWLNGDRGYNLAITLGLVSASLLLGCDRYATNESAADSVSKENTQQNGLELRSEEHLHDIATAGGFVTSFAKDAYHAEAVLEEDGKLEIYIFAADETQLFPVRQQNMVAYLREHVTAAATAVLVEPSPLTNDPNGMTSRFELRLPEEFSGEQLLITMPGLQVENERYMVRFVIQQSELPIMPAPVSDSQATELYLTAGGCYTEDDIEANGRQTAQQRYAGFKARHDPNPTPGDLVCPITQTKANSDCVWVIGGQTYAFCCPPCIDEFLQRAKSDPGSIDDAENYRKQDE